MSQTKPGASESGQGNSGQQSFRTEAGAFDYKDLTDDQKRATSRAYKMLCDMACADWTPGTAASTGLRAFLPRIDSVRHNRHILFDGGRGSGKTSAMLTLLDALGRTLESSDGTRPRTPLDVAPELQPEPGKKVPPLVPVGLIDLQPLPTSTKLMMHLASMFYRVIEGLLPTPPAERELPAWSPPGQRPLASTEHWRKLMQAIGLGWDDNLSRRAASLDPEAYVYELEQTERQRLDVRSAFHRFLDALVEDVRRAPFCQSSSPPLLVLFIDDADMNPERSVELIELISIMGHPRLAIVLTADSELFVTTLREHYLGVLRRPLQRLNLQSNELHHHFDTSSPNRLAIQVYDKAIPPGQRLLLGPLPSESRLDHRIENKTIGEAFGSIPVDSIAGDGTTLKAYFDTNPQLSDALPERLRGLANLHGFVAQLSRNERDVGAPSSTDTARGMPLSSAPPSPEAKHEHHVWAAEVCVYLLRDSIDSSYLFGIERAFVHDLLLFNRDRDILVVREDGIKWTARVSDINWLRRENESPAQRVIFRYPIQFMAEAHPRGEGEGKHRFALPERVTGALMLAIDLSSNDTWWRFMRSSYGLRDFDTAFVEVEYESKAAGRTLRLGWPVPNWPSFIDLANLANQWKAIGRSGVREAIPLWFQNILELVSRNPRPTSQTGAPDSLRSSAEIATGPIPSGLSTPSRINWSRLAKQVVEIGREPDLGGAPSAGRGRVSGRTLAGITWAQREVGLLAAPEYGLSSKDANEWLQALRAAFGDEQWNKIRPERTRSPGRSGTELDRATRGRRLLTS